MLLALWSPKGGSGTSVVAAALALVSAGRVDETRLADLGGDQPAILGLPVPDCGFGSARPSEGLTGWLAAGPSMPTDCLDEMSVAVVPGLTLNDPFALYAAYRKLKAKYDPGGNAQTLYMKVALAAR